MKEEFKTKIEALPSDWVRKQTTETREAYTLRVASALITYRFNDLQNADGQYRRSVMSNQMANAVVAAAQYRAKTGQWPENLGKLVPDYLASVPKDVFSKGGADDVRSNHDEHGFRVMSIGASGKDFLVGAAK